MNRDIYENYTDVRSYTKTVDIEKTFSDYSVGFEVSVRRWTDNAKMPQIDCISEIEAFDNGGHEVSLIMKACLTSVVQDWCRDNIDDILELIEKKESEE